MKAKTFWTWFRNMQFSIEKFILGPVQNDLTFPKWTVNDVNSKQTRFRKILDREF